MSGQDTLGPVTAEEGGTGGPAGSVQGAAQDQQNAGGAPGANGRRPKKPGPKRVVPTPDDEEFLVTLETLCAKLQLPVKTIRRMANKGQLPALRLGNRLCFSVRAVAERLQSLASRRNQFDEYPD